MYVLPPLQELFNSLISNNYLNLKLQEPFRRGRFATDDSTATRYQFFQKTLNISNKKFKKIN